MAERCYNVCDHCGKKITDDDDLLHGYVFRGELARFGKAIAGYKAGDDSPDDMEVIVDNHVRIETCSLECMFNYIRDKDGVGHKVVSAHLEKKLHIKSVF